ncbi:peptidase domain-containing ABC transporter [Inquilinus limosus]|uniref:peptidase domain-containing ABC transporter n=1 Tax=Inquilinus limosus TaxID=171674 RepID=UPI0004275698|nr:peptidase domain-containing ABC transporter [Inquilinus limosus]
MQILYQSERSECGLVALAMVASAHDLAIDLAGLRARFPISLKGATFKDLVAIANSLDLETRVLRCEPEHLAQVRTPAILHWRMNHFVVLAACRGNRFILHDPAAGRVVVTRAEMDECFTGFVLEAWPSPRFQKQDRRNRLRLSTVVPRSRGLVVAITCMFVYALGIELITLVLPILQQFVIDDALVAADTDLLELLTIAMGVFLAGQAVTTAIRGIVQRNLSSSLSLIVPTHVFRHLLALPTAWFERRSAADVINRFESGNTIHKTLTTSIVSAGIDGIVALAALAVMALYSPLLATVVVLAFIAYGMVRALRYSAYRQKSQGALVQNAKVQGLLWETMRGITTIKLFGGFDQRRAQYVAALSRYVRLQNGVETATVTFTFCHDVLFAIEKIAIIYLGAKAVLSNDFSVGMLTAFLGFRENFVTKGTSLINTAIEFRMLGIHLDRLADILLTEREKTTRLPFLGDREIRGDIEVREVSYRYGTAEADVLDRCSLSVRAGEIVAIVGPSGAGKSTLLKVLSGQIQADSGDVLIDGLSISSLGLDRLRSVIGVVRQDDMLFSGTLVENIAFLDEKPDHERVRAAARKARIQDEILRMPMGFNTLVGSMGTGLSGGQAQRLMLARALYRSPRILLLDEATSHLDLANEREISSALRDLGITQIIIAHRPETIAMADRVVDIRMINRVANISIAGELSGMDTQQTREPALVSAQT